MNHRPHAKLSSRRLSSSIGRFHWMVILAIAALTFAIRNAKGQEVQVKQALERVRSHTFHPLTDDKSFTVDRTLGQHGVADVRDSDGRVRLLAIRDLVIAGADAVPQMVVGLQDPNEHVRQVSAAAIGILSAANAAEALERVLQEDSSPLVRTQAALTLGEIGSRDSLEQLRQQLRDDPSRDVRHQCELAIDQIEKGMSATDELREAYRRLRRPDRL